MASALTFARPSSLTKGSIICLALLWAMLLAALPAAAQPSFITFESGQVRPVALTPDGTTLLTVNTPDNRLEVFSVDGGSLTHTGSIPVGMEPVAVADWNQRFAGATPATDAEPSACNPQPSSGPTLDP